MEYSGAGGKLIHEKNQKQKILDTVPLSNGHQYLLWPGDEKEDKHLVWKLERNAGKFIIIASDLSINYLFCGATCPISQVRLPF